MKIVVILKYGLSPSSVRTIEDIIKLNKLLIL